MADLRYLMENLGRPDGGVGEARLMEDFGRLVEDLGWPDGGFEIFDGEFGEA